MLLVKGAHEKHAHDSHYLLQLIFECQHINLFYMHVTSKGHMGSFPMNINLHNNIL